MMTIRKNLNILRTNSLSQETIRYPCFKAEFVSHSHKDPYTWNIQIFKKLKSLNLIQKILKLE